MLVITSISWVTIIKRQYCGSSLAWRLALCLTVVLSTSGPLNDSTVGVFRNCEYLRLRRACIRTARISAEAFQKALCPHRLLELDAARVNADLTIPDILQGLATNKYCQVKSECVSLCDLNQVKMETFIPIHIVLTLPCRSPSSDLS